MVKRGRRDKTTTFGTSAECYCSSLFQMHKHPDGNRMPDLVSRHFHPWLKMEIKSGLDGGKKGIDGKGILVNYQLHYGISTAKDYRDVFGIEPKYRFKYSCFF